MTAFDSTATLSPFVSLRGFDGRYEKSVFSMQAISRAFQTTEKRSGRLVMNLLSRSNITSFIAYSISPS